LTANTTADLDGNGRMSAGTKINIRTDSDAMNSTQDNSLNAGDFTQIGSASSSAEIAADGQEVDIFYNDGVNWPSGKSNPPTGWPSDLLRKAPPRRSRAPNDRSSACVLQALHYNRSWLKTPM
jgi:hypothetical protein